jgi:hypothetical protein
MTKEKGLRKAAVTRPEKPGRDGNGMGPAKGRRRDSARKCPSCGRPVGGRSKTCPACGANIDPGATHQA